MSKLVIVESPAKAKNIKGYLGKGYDVVASMGHVRDLPAARLSVDIAHDFAPKYAVIAGKENFVKDLKKKAQAADYPSGGRGHQLAPGHAAGAGYEREKPGHL